MLNKYEIITSKTRFFRYIPYIWNDTAVVLQPDMAYNFDNG